MLFPVFSRVNVYFIPSAFLMEIFSPSKKKPRGEEVNQNNARMP